MLLVVGLALAPAFTGLAADSDSDLIDQLKTKAEHGDAEAQLALGSAYANGIGVARDFKKAARWHRKAADQGLARAQYQLGMDYAGGDGVKEDKSEALRWFRRAAEQGLAEAQFGLGLAYANGRGIHPNAVEAVKWFRQAAEQGYAEAEDELGNCYLEGSGVPKDTALGVKWIARAAQAGSPRAQNTLGLCYQQGKGVPKDFVQAYKWLSLAAAQGGDDAADFQVSLAKIEAGLTPEQVAQAQSLAAQFKPGQIRDTNPLPDSSATPALRTGSVSVTTEDGSCDVYVDGNFVGNSPAKLQLTEGAHVVEVKRAGFKSYRRELKVGTGAELTLRPVLEKAGS